MPRHPLTAVPATRSSLPLLRSRRALVVGVALAAAVSGPITTVLTLSHHTATPAPVVLPNQAAVSLAQTVAEDFLAARKSTVPAAKNVNTDFSAPPGATQSGVQPLNAQSLTFASSVPFKLGETGQAVIQTEQETFNVLISGQLYAVTVPMEETPSGWILGAAPAVAPTSVAPDQSSDGIDYSQLYSDKASNTPLPQDYQNQIKAWAHTFASAGHASPALLALTGDQGERTYSGLNGWTLVQDPQVDSVVKVAASSAGPAGYIVRVSLVLRPPAANGPTLSMDYDLYLESDKSQQQPPVIAWGAAGSYYSLQPYMNADQH